MSAHPGNSLPFVRRLLSLTVLTFAILVLCACPRHQWHYTAPAAPTPSQNFDAHYDTAHPDPNGAPRNVDWFPQLQGHVPNPDQCNDGQPFSSIRGPGAVVLSSLWRQ